MDTLIEAFGYDFMRHAVYAGILASVLCGVIGTFVVVKRLVFISGGLSHAAFGGLGLFYYLGLNPIFGGFLVAVLASAGLGLGATRQGRPAGATADAMIGVLWAVGMAIGILFIYQTPGYAPNLMTYLFGYARRIGGRHERHLICFFVTLCTTRACRNITNSSKLCGVG